MREQAKREVKPVELEVFGPFELSVKKIGGTRVVEMTRKELIELAHRRYPRHNFAAKSGCYVFALRSGRGSMPYYVGKAQAQELCREALTSDKLNKYHLQLAKKSGTPILFFVASARPGDNKLPASVVNELERELIDACCLANPEGILNIHHLASARGRFRVAGVPWMGAGRTRGKPSTTAQEFNRLWSRFRAFR